MRWSVLNGMGILIFMGKMRNVFPRYLAMTLQKSLSGRACRLTGADLRENDLRNL